MEKDIRKIAAVRSIGVPESVVGAPCDALTEHVLDLVETVVNVNWAVVNGMQLGRSPVGESVPRLPEVLGLLRPRPVVVGVGVE